MDIEKACEESLIFASNEKLSKVVSALHSNGAHEGFIVDGREFKGVVSASDIVKKNVSNPEKAKLSGLSLIRKVKVFNTDAELKDVLNAFIVSDYRSVPVSFDGKFLNLTKLGLLKLIPKNILHGKRAEDVMFFPECVSVDDSISVVKSILKSSHVYRVAVLKGNKVQGIVDDLTILKTIISKEKKPGWERGGEKIKEDAIPISNGLFMSEDFLTASAGTELKYIVSQMLEKQKNTVVIEEGGNLLGIITPREIIKLMGSEISGVYLTVSGMQDEDAFIQTVVDSEIRNEVKKIAKIIHIHHMTIHVKRFRTTGKRMNFVVRGKLTSNRGLFIADHDSWNLTKSVREMLKNLRKEATKRVEKERDFGRE